MAIEPTIVDVVGGAIAGKLRDVHTGMPGKVVKYDSAAGTVDVLPVVRGAIEGEDGTLLLEDLPVISNVPVAWPRGGGFYIKFPLLQGDHVWLSFSETAMALWRTSGQISQPGDLRRHDLSYPIAFPCIAPDADALPTNGADELVIDGPGTLRMGASSADFVALAGLVRSELQRIMTAFDGHTHGVTALGSPTTNPAASVPPTPPLSPASDVAATKLKGS